jgi:UDP-galactopyranose mutase
VSDRFDILVVGAGYAGSIMARELAERREKRVLVIDRRDHIAGNAYDYYDEAGVQVHKYGPHIFHTNSPKIAEYLSRFTEWRPYEHRVLARVDGQLLPIPINRTTINELYGLELSDESEAQAFFEQRAEPVERIANSEDVVVAKVGRDLYEKFFRGYTRKQWQRDPSELHSSVCARIPVRTNTDDRYFTDEFQNMPAEGYTAMFERLLDHPLIEVRTSTDYYDVAADIGHGHLIWTGPIDGYFSNRFGALPYRSLEFELRTEPTPDGGYLQPTAQLNEPGEDVPYTRTTEFRHLSGQDDHPHSTVAVEYSRTEGHPYYPIPTDETRELYRRYEALAGEIADDVTFVGRLARYQYLNMDQVVGQALATAEKLIARLDARAA